MNGEQAQKADTILLHGTAQQHSTSTASRARSSHTSAEWHGTKAPTVPCQQHGTTTKAATLLLKQHGQSRSTAISQKHDQGSKEIS
jgi:hypothetical protein